MSPLQNVTGSGAPRLLVAMIVGAAAITGAGCGSSRSEQKERVEAAVSTLGNGKATCVDSRGKSKNDYVCTNAASTKFWYLVCDESACAVTYDDGKFRIVRVK